MNQISARHASWLACLWAMCTSGTGCDGGGSPPIQFESTCTPSLVWPSDWTEGTRAEKFQPEVAVYLDISGSMAGYLPEAQRGSKGRAPSTLDALVEQVPVQLQKSMVAAETRVNRLRFSREVLPGWPGPLQRSDLSGGVSDLSVALNAITRQLATGEIGAAALITDLIATGDTEGGVQAAQPLVQWSREAARGNHYAMGLYGVMADYWGTNPKKCSASGGLGCWYSPGSGTWVPVAVEAKSPLYALIFARDLETVETVGQALRETIQKTSPPDAASPEDGAPAATEGSKWEVLVGTGPLPPAALSCGPTSGARPPATVAAIKDDSRLHCFKGEPVSLSCPLSDASFASAGTLSGASVTGEWPGVTAAVAQDGAGVDLVLDCSQLRKLPAGPLGLVLNFQAAPIPDIWAPWSVSGATSQHKLGQTLRLSDFVAQVRASPLGMQFTCPSLLQGDPR